MFVFFKNRSSSYRHNNLSFNIVNIITNNLWNYFQRIVALIRFLCHSKVHRPVASLDRERLFPILYDSLIL